MKLPNAAEAVVPRNKVENYLLHIGHPIGGSKAKFSTCLDFDANPGQSWSTP
jgi:hypothetical protein